jgi:glucose/arabinose dehydrogenase
MASALLGLTGCATQTPTQSVQPPPAREATTGATSREALPLRDLTLGLEEVASGFEQPVFVTHAGDGSGRLFVVEQTGRVRVIRAGQTASQPFLDVSARVSSGGERGLLGLAFAPDYKETGRFYVNYTDAEGDTLVARFVAQDPASDTPRIQGPEVVLAVSQPYSNHNGGCIAFAPDGTLWVGMGDGGAAGDPQDNAQSDDSLLGKMLSLDVEGAENPEARMVQRGLRNPWRFSFDRETDEMWIGDVGQNAYEEVNAVAFSEAVGLDFGWARWEGDETYPPGAKRSREGFTFPILTYDRDTGQSVTGGCVYRGKKYPEMSGTYLFGDYVSGWIGGAQRSSEGTQWQLLLTETGISPSSFGEDEDGEVYVCDHGGSVLRITAE